MGTTWTAPLRDGLLLFVVGVTLGMVHLALRPEVPWTPSAESIAPLACEGDLPPPEAGVVALRRVRPDQLEVDGDPAIFVDARPAKDFLQGHVPGALSLPADEAAAVLASQSMPLPRDGDIVMYCGSPGAQDAEYVGRLLDETLGCDRVRVLEGGWDAWLANDGAVEGPLQSG